MHSYVANLGKDEMDEKVKTSDQTIGLPEQYHLGRLSALQDIKRSIIQWLSFGLTIFTIIGGILASIGISTTIDKRIDDEIDRRLKSIEERTDQVKVEAGVAQAQISSDIRRLNDLRREISKSRQTIEKLLANEEMSSILESIVVDFYKPKSITLTATVNFEKSLSEIDAEGGIVYPVGVDFLDPETGQELQFEVLTESITRIGMTSASYRLIPFIPYAADINKMKSVEELERFSHIQFRDTTTENQVQDGLMPKVRDMWNAMKSIEISGSVNGTQIFSYIVSNIEQEESIDEDGDYVTESSHDLKPFLNIRDRFLRAKTGNSELQ